MTWSPLKRWQIQLDSMGSNVMNNKYFSFLIICLVAGMLCMGGVCAKESTEVHNFGEFKMDVPKDSDFKEQSIDPENLNDMPGEMSAYVDEQSLMFVYYIYSPLFSGEGNSALYQLMFEGINVDVNQAYEYQDGNLRVIEPVHKSDMTFSEVALTSGNETVLLCGQDVSLLKEMGHSVKFT